MSDFDQLTKEVPPTSLQLPPVVIQRNIEELYQKIAVQFDFNMDELIRFRQGYEMEKNKKSRTLQIFQDVLLQALESTKINSENKNEINVHMQNKKIVKDLIVNLFYLLKHYSPNEKETKLLLLGKVIQSLYDSR